MEFNSETREGVSYLLLQRTVVEVADRSLSITGRCLEGRVKGARMLLGVHFPPPFVRQQAAGGRARSRQDRKRKSCLLARGRRKMRMERQQ